MQKFLPTADVTPLAKTGLAYQIGGAFDLVLSTVAQYYRVSREEILGESREERVAFARHAAIALCWELTGSSLQRVGDHFGRAPSTVWNSIRTAIESAEIYATVRCDLKGLAESLEPRVNGMLTGLNTLSWKERQ